MNPPLAFFGPRPFAAALLAATACHAGYAATTPAATTDSAGTSSRIAQVTVYPGSATVERVARVAAGARSFTFGCLPASLDSASLQVQADAAVRVGEFHIETKDRDVTPECASPLEGQIRSLEDQIAQVKAEQEALQLAQRYLGNVAGAAPGTPEPSKAEARLAPASAAQITATAEALRQSSQNAQQRQHQLERRQQALELALKPLQTEQSRVASQQAQVVSVTVNLATAQEAALRLSYQVRGPSWQPSYRATLQADKASVQLERLALVAQSSGEDWNNVQLTLSTGQPGRATQGRLPRPWTLDVAPPPRPAAPAAAMMMAPAPAPAMRENMAAKTRALVLEEEMPSFDVSVLNKGFATEFAVPQRISVPSSGQRVTLALGSQQTNAQLFTRIAPAEEEAAYLVAQLQTPPGVWPAGPVGLYRDGAFVGNGRLDFAANTDSNAQGSSLWFGRDELVQVRASAPEQMTSSTGLTGSRTERRTRRSYHIDNRHSSPITLQVLHAAPVSRHEKIEVESHYQPAPHSTAWNGQPGTIVWQQPLAAGASASFSAEHTIRHHQELELLERH
ncbi:MAG: mucoidy inhibitor MuiA family protein [Giesbergeria sp.]|uniref:DUF4139 domain-containing protein n=1 Tax=Giesbergeria sp. TaxID=2818473 RepID=UPI0026210AF1|nr:mucoidy inhibitor MuiA family protein [Giesbergeria sp.]MDD2610381.1 mucoidy inhibitor MuiA family protein [Giesbergeria sp.]